MCRLPDAHVVSGDGGNVSVGASLIRGGDDCGSSGISAGVVVILRVVLVP